MNLPRLLLAYVIGVAAGALLATAIAAALDIHSSGPVFLIGIVCGFLCTMAAAWLLENALAP